MLDAEKDWVGGLEEDEDDDGDSLDLDLENESLELDIASDDLAFIFP